MREAVDTDAVPSGEYDAVIDFDAIVRDPSFPTRLLPLYDSGDHLHPNDLRLQDNGRCSRSGPIQERQGQPAIQRWRSWSW